jgi:nucleoside-diphosphate-sugar epimerase
MRIDDASLRRMRAGRTSRILVTGGTGFIGSHVAAALLRAGYRVAVLARATKALSARARIERLAGWLGLDDEARRRLAVVDGDVLETGWAAAAAEAGGADEIVHCASSTAFAERKRAEIEAANIGGLRNVLDFAARSGCAFFHHVSTAYVAGRRTGPCPEDWIESAEFTNVYEETKARGEVLARDLCRREGLRLNVYRPTIVIGDSRTGRTLRFNALYFPVKAAVYLRDIYLADIRERGGRRAAEMGIRPAEDGRLIMPLRTKIGGGGINLVPVDHCVAAFMAVFEDGIDGGIYHIASPAPTRIEDIIAYTKRFFRLDGIEACGPEAFAGRPRNALEILYDSYLETYRPYMQETRTFESANAAPMLARRGLACPAFDYDMYGRCMSYALEVDWGSKLFAR